MAMAPAVEQMARSSDVQAGLAVSRPRRKVRRALIGAALLLLLSEVGLRVRSYYRHGSTGLLATLDTPDALPEYRLRPGVSVSSASRQLSINQWGFRGRQIPFVKPPGTTRIAVLGDSITFGLEASSDQAVWVAQMVENLNASSSTHRYDAINGGIRRYTLAASIYQLTETIAPLDPDIVVVFQINSDLTFHARRQFDRPNSCGKTASPVDRFTLKHSLLLRLLLLNTTAIKAKYFEQGRFKRLDQAGLLAYESRLRNVADLCRRRGWRLVLCTGCRAFGDVTAPTDQYNLAQSALAANRWLSLDGLNDGFDRYNQAIRRVARECAVTLVDLDQLVPKRKAYFADAVHLSDLGHRVIGKAVAQGILQAPASTAPKASAPPMPADSRGL